MRWAEGRSAPPWWPEGEPWPPRGRHFRGHPARARFIVRAGVLFGVFLLLSLIGGITLASWALRSLTGLGASAVPVAILAAGAAGLALILLWTIGRRIGSPVGDLVGAAHRVADGDYVVRVRPYGPPFLRVVASAFNDMAGRLARQEEQRRIVMTDLAHELRTPLSIARGRLEGMVDGVYPVTREALEPLLDQLNTLTRLVEDLRALATAESGGLVLEREPTDLGVLLHDAIDAVREEASAARVSLTVEDETRGRTFDVDPVRIRQVVMNLLTNAIRHGGAGQRVVVRARVTDRLLRVSVADYGPGPSEEDLARLFTRFYRGRDSRGSGLGLTIARNLVRAHGGDITATRGETGGLVVTFAIPIAG